VNAAAERLRSAGSSSARLDAELLVAHVTRWSRAEVLAHPDRAVDSRSAGRFQELVARRVASEPIAYLLGEREFYGRVFRVDRRALIPRPETELLVELGLSAVARWRAAGISPRVFDIGTGAGAIAVSLAAEANVSVVATDMSFGALTLARENAFLHGVGRRVSLVQADLLAPVPGPLHVVLANLPYVPLSRPLPRDVKDYEPGMALFGGQRGPELIERLLAQAAPLLAPRAELAMELDEEQQAAPVASLARDLYPAADVSICQDAGGYDRVVRVAT